MGLCVNVAAATKLFEAWGDLGEMETDICRVCDNEEQEQMLWERDEFGARG